MTTNVDSRRKTATLFDSKVALFKQSEHEHQGAQYAPDVLGVISRLEIASVLDAIDLPSKHPGTQPEYTVLDIGAGGGRWTLALAETASAIVAVEPSALFDVLVARTAGLAHVTCIHGPFEEFEATTQFDLVIIYGTLMYVGPDQDARDFLAKASAAVKPGGHLVVGEAVARRYKCLADWEEVAPEEFIHEVLPGCRYWEVLRTTRFYRDICRSNGLTLLKEFESHAPIFGQSGAWQVIRRTPWVVFRLYNQTWRGIYGALKWALDIRRMRLMVWTRTRPSRRDD